MIRTPSFAACLLAFACVACSTTRLALEPIEPARELPLTCRTGWDVAAPAPAAERGATTDSTAPRVSVAFVRLSVAESERLFGPIGARPTAFEVQAADADRWLASLRAQSAERILDAGAVSVSASEPGEVRATRQCAYISAFEYSQTPGAAIADPVVQVLEEGTVLRLSRAQPTGEEFDVEVVLSDLEHPMREHVIRLAGAVPVTVQEPACLTQRIQTQAELSQERALLLAGLPVREPGQTLLVVLCRE